MNSRDGLGLKILRFWFPVILYSAIIFYVSSLSGDQTLDIGYFDKIVHIVEFMPFGFLLTRAFCRTSSFLWNTITVGVVLLSFLYGLSDEFHQSFSEGRESALADAFADTIGGAIGVYVYAFLEKESSIRTRG